MQEGSDRMAQMPKLRNTKQREAIRENLIHRSDHPTADMIYSDIKEAYPNISLGTVYRNLAVLEELGEILKLPITDGSSRYDGNVQPHNHFICRKCGCVFDLDDLDMSELKAQAQKSFDGTIEDCKISFYGLCKNCQGL